MPVRKSKPPKKKYEVKKNAVEAEVIEKELEATEQLETTEQTIAQTETHQKTEEEKKQDQNKNQAEEAQESQNGEKQEQIQHPESQPQASFENTKEAVEKEKVKFDISAVTFATAESNPKGSSKPGVLSIINSEKNGKRVSLSKEVKEWLGIEAEDTVQVCFLKDAIAIGTDISKDEKRYKVSESKNKAMLYSTPLVREICKNFGLEFEDGKVSQTFYEAEYIDSDCGLIVMVKMNQED